MKNLWNERAVRYAEGSGIQSYIQMRFDNNIKKIITRNLNVDKSMNVLDAGCGKGRWAMWFSTRAKNVIGIDNSEKPIWYGKECSKRLDIDNVEFINADIREIPLASNSVDLTFVCITLQHIDLERDFNRAIEEIMRVTKGYVIVMETIRQKTRTRFGYIACRSAEKYVEAFESQGAKLLKVSGVRCPYLYYGYLTLLKLLFRTGDEYEDVRDREVLWEKINNSRAYGLISVGFKLVLVCSKPFDILSKRIPRLSTEGVLIFRT